jgi:hypothetical protein
LLFGPFVSTMLTPVELDDADRAALIALLKQTIAADPFPLSARSRTFKAIIAKLDPPPRKPSTERIGDNCRDERKHAQPAEDRNRQLYPRSGHGPAEGGRGPAHRQSKAYCGAVAGE